MSVNKKPVKTAPKKEAVKVEKLVKKVAPPKPNTLSTVSPKYHYANMVRELFKRDPEIKMEFDQKKCVIDMTVDNEIKALAIRKILPETKEFVDGTITINVKLKADRFGGDKYLRDTVFEAFKGNPLFDYQYWWENEEGMTNPCCWVSMIPNAVFYPESNLHNVWGDSVNLPEELATAIVPDITNFIYFCSTNAERELPDHNVRKFNE